MNASSDKGHDEHSAFSVGSIIEDIAHFLPTQGPLRTFVHHNTLHHFEDVEFFSAVKLAGSIFGAKTSLPERFYQEQLRVGRISYADINRCLGSLPDENVSWPFGTSQRKFFRDFFKMSPGVITEEALRWRLIERRDLYTFNADVVEKKRAEILASDASIELHDIEYLFSEYAAVASSYDTPWLIECIPARLAGERSRGEWKSEDSLGLLWMFSFLLGSRVIRQKHVALVQPAPTPSSGRIEQLVNPYLIKFTASYLDTGLAHFSVVDREKGLLPVFLEHLAHRSIVRPGWVCGEAADYIGRSGHTIISTILSKLGLPQSEWREYLLRKLLLLRGWGGLVHQTELGVSGFDSRASLEDFLAVRLILEQMAGAWIEQHPLWSATSQGAISAPSKGIGASRGVGDVIRYAYHLFNTFQMLPCSARELLSLKDADTEMLVDVVVRCNAETRLRVWQCAYEWNLYARFSAALLEHRGQQMAKGSQKPPAKCQVVCCIDDREESFRRYLEELNSGYETFGTAGFFGVDAEFHSLYERPAPYCPANITPTHKVTIAPRQGSERRLQGLLKAKSISAEWQMYIEMKSRSLVRGWILALGGLLALIPLSLSTLAPRTMPRLRIGFRKRLLDANDESSVQFADGDGSAGVGGFTVEEMAHRVRVLITTTGLYNKLSALVIIMGHGSFSSNNPYRSAYDCGACGGRPGRLNSRVFALMANRRDVRELLTTQGIKIPDSTHFLGSYHNTCTDEVEYFDTTALPETHGRLLDQVKLDIDRARALNAFERCRRFDDVTVNDVNKALAHVESRAHHIAQPRPEYGHATNAICFVGRREITEGLFLDRRAFLISYDKTIDPSGDTLHNLLRAVIPVCMGINLEYFFSSLDNQVYGAGSKLPHNVTSLLGLMTGYCSDLRTGLPAQMVEIHEAVRLLFMVEREPDELMDILRREESLEKVARNGWLKLMSYSAERNQIFYLDEKGEFQEFSDVPTVLERVGSSKDWVTGKKDHLGFVQVAGG